ncbi:MAG: hypothetical protein U0744_09155 [Gemmataceae bacterium]
MAVNMLLDLHATQGQASALGADKGFDDGEFSGVEWIGVEPHVPLVKDPVDLANRSRRGRATTPGIRGDACGGG